MKTALVTGGSHGIGLATAHALADAGYQVCIFSRGNFPESRNDRFYSWVGDALDDASIESCVNNITDDFGGIDVLVNNCGGGGRWGFDPPQETPMQTWREVQQKNSGATSLFTQLSLPRMRALGWGRVITVASIYGKESGGRPWFDGTKAYEIAMMKSMSRMPEYVRNGITFNTVAPGRIAVGGKEDDLTPERLSADYPMGRVGKPEEVAALIAFLCSDHAAYINGACIAVDGGESRSF